jgi:hypothetical protein
MTRERRMTPLLIGLALICAVSFGAIVKLAFADDYHVTCVGHGFLNGASTTDGSFFSRVENGCGAGWRSCDLYVSGVHLGGITSSGSCNAWSRTYGDYTECHGTSHTEFTPYFNDHVHKSSNWCG